MMVGMNLTKIHFKHTWFALSKQTVLSVLQKQNLILIVEGQTVI
jgi:hypothetical protein